MKVRHSRAGDFFMVGDIVVNHCPAVAKFGVTYHIEKLEMLGNQLEVARLNDGVTYNPSWLALIVDPITGEVERFDDYAR